MARNQTNPEPEIDRTMSVVGAGMTFTGDCETEGGLRVDGTVDGSVRAGRVLEIGPQGVVKGDVRAREATVAGTVHGTMVVDSRLELRSTGRLDGEIYAARMTVADGAMVNASMRMGDRPAALGAPEHPSSKPELKLDPAPADGAEGEPEAGDEKARRVGVG